jgi:hypothetical protein
MPLVVAGVETRVSSLGSGWCAGGGVDGAQIWAEFFGRRMGCVGLMVFGGCVISYALLAADQLKYFLCTALGKAVTC